MSTIIDHIPGSTQDFLDAFKAADGAGSAGEALLAVALGSRSADARKRAKALLKKCKQPRLDAALKALPRRVYDNSDATLADDLALLESLGELNMPAFAFHLVNLHWRYETAWAWCAEHVPESYVRQLAESALEKDATQLRFERALPSASLYPVLSELRGVEALSFHVFDSCPMPDLRHLDGLRALGMTGPVQDLPAAHIEGLPLQNFFLQDTSIQDLTALSSVRTLQTLTVRGGQVSVLGSADWPELTSLQLRNLPALTTLPAFGKLSNLATLEIKHCGVSSMPEDIGTCSALREVTLSSLPLCTLPESMGALRLDSLNVFDLHLRDLPAWDDAVPPKHVGHLDLTFEDTPSVGACRFLKLPSTATLAGELLEYLDHSCMAKGPRIQAALGAWERGADLASAKVPELLVAIRRTYHDEEHGPSTNRFLADLITKHGGPVEQAASQLLPNTEARSQAVIKSDAELLASVPGFDAQAYAAFAQEAVGL